MQFIKRTGDLLKGVYFIKFILRKIIGDLSIFIEETF